MNATRKTSINVSVSYLIAFCLFVSTAGLAEEVTIAPYQASYQFYINGFKVARSILSLEQSGRFWRWRLSSNPIGVYKLFTDKKPYSETTFSLLDSQYRIHDILLADKGSDKRYESARFDWSSRQIDVQRKGKRQVESLPDQVYDFHTIHLLIARMLNDGTLQLAFNYYLKGKVYRAKLERKGITMLEINDVKIEATVFHQSIGGQKTTSTYYYGPNSRLLPLKIENINSKGKTSIMILDQVAWL